MNPFLFTTTLCYLWLPFWEGSQGRHLDHPKALLGHRQHLKETCDGKQAGMRKLLWSADQHGRHAADEFLKACGSSLSDLLLPADPTAPPCGASMLTAMQKFHRDYDRPLLMPECNVPWHTAEDSCQILSRFGHVIFIGDSLTRGVYEALVALLRNDMRAGALRPEAARAACECGENPQECKLDSMGWKGIPFEDLVAKWWAVHEECGVQLHMLHIYANAKAYAPTDIMPIASHILQENPGSLVFVGGYPFHRQCASCHKLDVEAILTEIVKPLQAVATAQTVLIVALVHAHENEKVPSIYQHEQSTPEVLAYNAALAAYCEANQLPIFDTYAMTKNVATVDGTHHTLAVNLMKVQMLLEWLAA